MEKNKNYHIVGTLIHCTGNKPVHNKILINKLRMEGKQQR